MLTVRLEEKTGEAEVSLPPTPQVRLKGCDLCVGPDDQPLVRHEPPLGQKRRRWTYGAVSFSAALIDQPICVCFQSHSGDVKDAGCYDGLRIADGRLFVGGKPGKLLASYDEVRGTWTSADGVSQASQVLIVPASPIGRTGENDFERD